MKVFVYLILTLGVASCATTVDVNNYAKSDSFIQDLLSEKLGSSNSGFKTLFRVQNGAFELLSGMTKNLTEAKREKFQKMLDVAAKANNTEKVNELLGKILYTMQSILTPKELAAIVAKYAPLLNPTPTPETPADEMSSYSRYRRSTDPFDQIYEHLYVLEGGSTLLFTIDTTGSMSAEIVEAKNIALDIIDLPRLDEVNYVLSPFNDPSHGPVTIREHSKRSLFVNDINKLRASGGGDCAELAIDGINNGLNSDPRYGSSMFVFTDAEPKNADDFNVQNIIDTAAYVFDLKISFFLSNTMCGKKENIDKYRHIAEETGGEVFTMSRGPSGKRRKRSTTRSTYSSFVSSSLRGTSLIASKISGTTQLQTTTNYHGFDVDDQIAYLNVVVTFVDKSTVISLSNPSKVDNRPTVTTSDAVIYEVENPVTGGWYLKVVGTSAYSYKISVAFKEPIAFDVRYFYQENAKKYIMIQKPLAGEEQQVMINVVGSDKIDASSLIASLVDLEGKHLVVLNHTDVGRKDKEIKLKVKYTPPNVPFRVALLGKTKTGFSFNRATEGVSQAAQIVFKTVRAGDEFSANIGALRVRIMNVLFIKSGEGKSVTLKAKATLGQITAGVQTTKTIRRRGFFFLEYEAPTDKNLRGKSDYIVLQASFEGSEITTHRFSILLM